MQRSSKSIAANKAKKSPELNIDLWGHIYSFLSIKDAASSSASNSTLNLARMLNQGERVPVHFPDRKTEYPAHLSDEQIIKAKSAEFKTAYAQEYKYKDNASDTIKNLDPNIIHLFELIKDNDIEGLDKGMKAKKFTLEDIVQHIDIHGNTPGLYVFKNRKKYQRILDYIYQSAVNDFRKSDNTDEIDVTKQGPFGYTILHIAVRCGQSVDTVKDLLTAGADVNAEDFNKETPLHLATKFENEELTALLLAQNDINVNAVRNNGSTSLHIAYMEVSNKNITNLLLKHGEIAVDSKLDGDYTVSFETCKRGDITTLKQLHLKGANLHIKRDEKNGKDSLLHDAAQGGHINVVEYLLENNVDVNAENSAGVTALYLAAQQGHDKVVQRLLKQNNIKVNSVNKKCDNATALLVACEKGHYQVVKDILESGKANIEATLGNGATALIVAAYQNHEDIVELLIQHGARKDAAMRDGQTAASITDSDEIKRMVSVGSNQLGIGRL